MRVAVVMEQALAPAPGGTGRYSLELAAGLVRTGTPPDGVAGWVAAHRDVTAARVAGVAGPRRLPLGRRLLARAWARGVGPAPRGADVVHAPTLLVPPAARGVPLVVTIHDAVPWTHPATMTPHGVRWHQAMAERAAATAAAITVPTEAVAAQLAAVWPGAPTDRIHVLGAGVGGDLLAAVSARDASARLARLGLDPGPDRRFVLTLATLEPRKGLDVLVAALARLPEARRPLLVSVGAAGWGDVDLDRTARAAGLPPEAVRALGRLDDADLGAVLAAATVLVVPSRAEGFGLPVAEAMAAGVPVVVTDVPALVEVAGGAAAVVPVDDPAALADVITDLMGDPARRQEMAAAGRLAAQAHSWDAVAHRAWALYRSLAGSTSG